jgi:hypothetical protein
VLYLRAPRLFETLLQSKGDGSHLCRNGVKSCILSKHSAANRHPSDNRNGTDR